ncbi:MAG TPA: biotin--[acetyl-CoA-carboxylase] ligase [Syntrophomonadaceae bacterium]|nr:biotin--[acetyl-CoA-carboxylase] ligase [Syntrophomonadaceae bacterium]
MRSKIIQALKLTGEQPLSGNDIAEKLGVSRVAVWKHIETLRQEGYLIEAIPGQGYRLQEADNILDVQAIAASLKQDTIFKQFYYYPRLDSTSTRIRELLQEGQAAEGTVVAALCQSEGRGRLGRDWSSPAGGLWFSFLLRPQLPLQETACLSLLFALAISRTLQDFVDKDEVMIKWPNDVLIKDKKVAGILLETAGELDRIEYLISGIGINVNLASDDFPPPLQGQATSLLENRGTPADIQAVFLSTLQSIDRYYRRFLQEGFPAFCEEYKGLCYHLGRPVRIQTGQRVIAGTHIDIDSSGAMRVRSSTGIEVIHTGDVHVLDRGRDQHASETTRN